MTIDGTGIIEPMMTHYIIDIIPDGMYQIIVMTGIKQIIQGKASKRVIQVRTMIPIGGKVISQIQRYGKTFRRSNRKNHMIRVTPLITMVGILVIQTGIQTGDFFIL